MSFPKPLFWLVPLVTTLNLWVTVPRAVAYCADSIAPLEFVQSAMEERWQELQQQKTYPWGKARPYGKLEGDRITLSPEFDYLSGPQKRLVLELLGLDNNNALKWQLPSPQPGDSPSPSFGEIPYTVYASDGRAISLPYDGCTRMNLFTERERFSWYIDRRPTENHTEVSLEALRNAGQPAWRQPKFIVSPQQEKETRLKFWKAVGYTQSQQGWWISWVPEQGYFEINVPSHYEASRLRRFWQVAPRQYRYAIVTTEGTSLQEKHF